jgi:Na+:H+ antiporter, NhaA family
MVPRRSLTSTFRRFFESESHGAVLLIVCTAASLVAANSAIGPAYAAFWQSGVAGLTVEHWINDALMAVFFLLVGLELERELYVGELSDGRTALLPILAALGGVGLPAGIHYALNAGSASQAGMGIPMATDIAFALGALALLGSRVPASLKVFLAALAVMDDLAAIVVIAVFYTATLSYAYLAAAAGVFATLVALNRLKVMSLIPYLVGGALMWFLMLKSGVHATITGVLLAFAIPFGPRDEGEHAPSHRLENFLHRPVALGILPLFALANTGLAFSGDALPQLASANSLGIIAGLLLGKPIGITLLALLAVALGLCRLPPDVGWNHVFGVGLLAGIGFTMSIFITNLAFAGDMQLINSSKAAILTASFAAGLCGLAWLRMSLRRMPVPEPNGTAG